MNTASAGKITDKDARYDEMFQVENEAQTLGTMLLDDPYPKFAEMLKKAPVLHGSLAECMGLPATAAGHMYKEGFKYATALSFAAVSDVFVRKDDFDSGFYRDMRVDVQLGDGILSMDGLRHRRYRDLIQPFFQPGYAGSWWNDKVIYSAVDHLVADIEKNGRADLNADLFARLPMHVVTAGFGMSPSEGLAFRHHMQCVVSHNTTPAEQAEHGKAANDILNDVIRARQAKPEDDIISKLAEAKLREDDGSTRPLTVDEINAYCRLIVFAGGGTTWRQSGITFFALMNNPDQMDAVRKDRSLLNNAVLESTRWHTTDPLFPRKAIRDTVLQGVPIEKDTVIHVCIGAANHDPIRWENPEKFDLHRPIQRSTAFAAGAHSCLGQHVARQEILVAMNAILDRLPNIRWDDSKPPAQLMGGLIGRGPGPLHVLFG